MPKLLRSTGRRLTGAANPNFGKAWGNALGGFASQPRVAGRFATKGQAKAFAKASRGARVKGALGNAKIKMGLGNASKPKAIGASVTGGVIATAFAANKLNPSLSVSRKRVQVGIRPSAKIGPFTAYTSHSIGIEREGKDAIDRAKDRVERRASNEINRRLGGGTASTVAHGVIGINNYKGQEGGIKIDGKIGNPRLRYSSKKSPPPGAPASAAGGKTAARPQGKRKGARTVTNATKGTSGAVRPQRRGGGKKKKKAKK